VGTEHDDNLDELRAALRGSVAELCHELLGKPDQRSGSEWRWGKKGSFAVAVAGPKRGLWHDHEAGTGGDMLALIRRERGGSFPETVEWARGFVGMAENDGAEWKPHQRRAKPEQERKAEDAEDAAKRERPRRIWSDAVPVEPGSIGDRYLTEARGIPRPAGGWGPAVRFHRFRCALVLGATTAAGDVQAVQLIHLTPEGKKLPADNGRPVKQSFGPQEGAVVRLAGEGSVLVLAEGPETGLTAWAATGRETWVALGSMAKVEPPALRRLLVVADDDPRDAPAAKQLRKAVVKWRGEAREVAVVTPWPRRRFDKSDLNDLIQREGVEAVRARILAALNPKDPHPPGARLPIPLARHRLGEAVARFFRVARKHNDDRDEIENAAKAAEKAAQKAAAKEEAAKAAARGETIAKDRKKRPRITPQPEFPAPPVHGAKVGVGIGKSEAVRREAADYLAELRAAGDKRTVVIVVPTHKLGEEQARAFEALPQAQAAGLKAGVWRGRRAPDPEQPGQAMCHDLDAVDDARAAGISNVEKAVCQDEDAGTTCPFFKVCGYQRQKQQEADFWIGAHELLFGTKPAALGKPAVVIVDEAAWRKGLEGVDGQPQDLTLGALSRDVEVPNDLAGVDTQVLRNAHGVLADALPRLPLGSLRKADIAALLLPETVAACRAISWNRIVPVSIHPGMTPAARREAMAQAPNNREAARLARIFAALEALVAENGPEASGWVGLAEVETPDGPVRMLRLRGRRPVAKGWQVPTIILDALLQPELVRPYWPQVEVTAEIEARTPYMRVRQQVGRDWAKSALVPDDYSPGDRDRRLKNSERLRAAVWREVRARGGRSLVVAQKAVEEYWRTCGVMPQGLEMAHHNAVAGRDEWGPGPGREGVRSLVVIGRTLPRPRDVERMAEALTGAAVAARASRYDRVDAAILLADGTAATTEADRHPDPLAEAIRWQVCEGELIQIVGRARAVNRTAADPVEVLILTDRPLPIPVDEAVSWEGLMPSAQDLMLAQGGVFLESPTDASRCYPNLWATPAAAKMAASRGQWVTSPYREYPIGECYPLVRATYQRAGERQRPAALVFDPSAVPVDDLRGWLEDRLGELAKLEVETPPPPPPEPPRPSPPDEAPGASEAPAGGGATPGRREAPSSGFPGASAGVWAGAEGELRPPLSRAGIVEFVDLRRPGGG
jgi:putative DNA primase/helicase